MCYNVLMTEDPIIPALSRFHNFTIEHDANPLPINGKMVHNTYDTVRWRCDECKTISKLSFPVTNAIILLWKDYARHVTEKHL